MSRSFFPLIAWLLTASGFIHGQDPEYLEVARDPEIRYMTHRQPFPFADKNQPLLVTQFHRSPQGECAFWRLGNLQFLSLGTDSIHNISRSVNNGWNHGAFPYFSNGDFHLLGGYGFWESHFDDIVFLPSRGEWERLTRSKDFSKPPSFAEHKAFVVSNEMLGWLDWRTTAEFPNKAGFLWQRNRSGGAWLPTHRMHPPISPSHVQMLFDLKDFLLIGQFNGAVLVIRKSDWLYKVSLNQPTWIEMSKRLPPVFQIIANDWIEFRWDSTASLTLSIDSILHATESQSWSPLLEELSESEAQEVLGVDPNSDDERSPLNARLLWAIACILTFGTGIYLSQFIHERKRMQQRRARVDQSAPLLDDLGLSEDLYSLVMSSKNSMNLMEFDALFPSTSELGQEAVRSKRARKFRELNMESMNVFGFPILKRERDPSDSRMYIYVIQPLPKWVKADKD